MQEYNVYIIDLDGKVKRQIGKKLSKEKAERCVLSGLTRVNENHYVAEFLDGGVDEIVLLNNSILK